ncbi:secretin N-terminal domain-containing protein [Rubellicoccus peritrichatus]|uniref:Secretin N-terminal domain-containing protein n=1 Tax=Rubellicoccus peritrichatus TaxID=3080537 RepID=A0AAQ3L972_9BACT|nr:secretin N-terminal domain-containing protein [Puniceicoccus sp. CR14]WOO41406.1 secretin N-terminal domain-containing protein [Puniceicoccus sp. CR14]
MIPNQVKLLTLALLLFSPVMAQDSASQDSADSEPVKVNPTSSPSSPEDTSTADSLLPSTATPEEKKVEAEKTAEASTSSADDAFPGEGPGNSENKDQLTMDIENSVAAASEPVPDDNAGEGASAVADTSTTTTPVSTTTTPVDTSAATDATTDASDSSSEPSSGIEPVQSYAPDTSGMTVKEVKVEEPSLQAVLEPGEKPKMEEEMQEIPALEVDFPDSGEMTLEFPTDEQSETDLEMGVDDTISVDFPDEEVRTVIRNVADLYDLNVVIPDTLVGSTSVKLRNVTWRQVFEVVLEPLGYTYVEDRNIIKIRSRDELLQEPVDTRVFLINYAVAKNLQASLAPLIDAAAGGRIQVDDRTNALIITERPSRMNDIQEIIERLDRPNAQVMIESKFIEVNDRDQENLGVNWSSLNAYRISAGPFQRDYSREATGDNNNNTSNTSNNSTTSTSTVTNGSATNTFTNAVGTTFNNAADAAASAITSRIDTAVFSAPAFEVVLSALETLSDSKLLTNPTLVTLDGEDAKILIGDKYPVPSYTYNEERGTFEVSGFEYEDIGIVLTVRPQVNAAGFIRLDVNPVLSRQNGEVNFGGAGGAVIPIINSTETESSVILKDGYTLAIGGLIQNDILDSESKVPLLGDLPGLGYLFKSTSKDNTERNLIIFITARTLNPDGTTYKDIIDPRMLYRMGITEKDIPGLKIPDAQTQAMDQIFQMRSQVEHDLEEAEMFDKVSTLKAAAEAKEQKEADEESGKRKAVSRAR